MNSDMNTLELAKLYESQGYYDKAHEIYTILAKQDQPEEESVEVKEGLKRLESFMFESPGEDAILGAEELDTDSSENKIASLLEQWIELLVVRQRLDKFKRIKARLL